MGNAGIVLATKFVKPGSRAFKRYIEYIDRDEAIRNDKFTEYCDLNDHSFAEYAGTYMANPEKTYGLFTEQKDALTEHEKVGLKENYEQAQSKGSMLWQTVFSFENEWLAKHGIYDMESGKLDENALRQYTRQSIRSLQKKEKMESAVWSAAVHKNTKHLHVHIAMVDPEPSHMLGKGRCRISKSGELYQRGKFEQGSINHAKSVFANNILTYSRENHKIHSTEKLTQSIGQKMQHLLFQTRAKQPFSKEHLDDDFIELVQALPSDLRLLKYGNNAMKQYRPMIDNLTFKLLDGYFRAEYDELCELLDSQQEEYQNMYGGQTNRYKENKIRELYKDLGNNTLTEARGIIKNTRGDSSNSASDTNRKSSAKRMNSVNVGQAIHSLKRLARNNIQSAKNQAAYERLRQQEDMERA